MKNLKKAFTLIELLVVIAIIGILSTIGVVSFNSARKKARDARRISDLQKVKKALYMYYTEYEHFPMKGDFGQSCDVAYYEGGQGGCTLWYYLVKAGYFKSGLPRDPLMPESCFGKAWTCCPNNKPNEFAYRYYYKTQGQDFELSARLEANDEKMKNDGGNDDSRYEIGIHIDQIDTSPCNYQ